MKQTCLAADSFRQTIVLLVAVLGWWSHAAAAAGTAKPNVLIMLADDLGFADVGFNGGRTIATPNLDRLAATGVNLTDFRACPMCSPTRVGLMTGRWPHRFGMMRAVVPPWSGYGIPAEEATLPELLAGAGYRQRGIVGKWHLGHARREYLPLANGFTRFDGHYNGAIDYFTLERDGEREWHDDDCTSPDSGYATDLIGQQAARFIQSAAAGEPAAKPVLELYDLATDVAEKTDLAEREPRLVAALHQRLREFGTGQKSGVGPYSEGQAGFTPTQDWVVGAAPRPRSERADQPAKKKKKAK